MGYVCQKEFGLIYCGIFMQGSAAQYLLPNASLQFQCGAQLIISASQRATGNWMETATDELISFLFWSEQIKLICPAVSITSTIDVPQSRSNANEALELNTHWMNQAPSSSSSSARQNKDVFSVFKSVL